MKQKLTIGAAVLLLPLFPLELCAHDLYILPAAFHVRSGNVLQVAYHNGDAFPESESAPRPVRLLHAQLRSAQSVEEVTNLHIAGNETLGEVRVPGGGSLQLSVETVPNFIELAPDKFESYLKEEGLTDVMAWRTAHHEALKPGRERYTKFAKSLLRTDTSDGFFKRPLGLLIEIVPQRDPALLHKGERLPIQVLFQGKPAAGLQIEAARTAGANALITAVGRTDGHGRLEVPLDSTGKWRLHTLKMQRALGMTTPQERQAADWESFWASLTFVIEN